MAKRNFEIKNNFSLLLLRLSLIYVAMGLCRLFFYLYNADILAPVTLSALPSIIKGSFIFDTASIFYTNILFIFLSLIPFYFRERDWWQKMLGILFTVTNSVAIFINFSDSFYFPFKLSRIAGDDFRYFAEDNLVSLFFSFMGQYWWGAIILVIFIFLLYNIGFNLFRLKKNVRFKLHKPFFYTLQTIMLAASVLFAIVGIRGFSISSATFPITMSDATSYVEPKYASLILSNPFCLIRTFNHSLVSPKLTTENIDEEVYSPVHSGESVKSGESGESTQSGESGKSGESTQYNNQNINAENNQANLQYSIKGMNIMLIVLESFGSAHIKSLSDNFSENETSYTPFLDSLFQKGLLMTSAYQSGGRSIDAMPAMWASIPSYKQNFLSLPQSQATYEALPSVLKNLGYSTSFMHGATKSSMSFQSFGEMVGIDNFTSLEDYEKANSNSSDDFDGKWGIFDHKFLPFTLDRVDELKKPFFNTIFTLSSHNPYVLPKGYENRYPKGKMEIHETIAYSDDALRDFFNRAKTKSWYDNTLFIITADHGSGADNSKWKGTPYNYRVPLFFYTPSGKFPAVKMDRVVSHVDIMPTILSLLDYKDDFFSYGTSFFDKSKKEPFVVNNFMGTYNVITKDILYQFNETDLVGVYDYIGDYKLEHNLIDSHTSSEIDYYKAYIQNYYTRVKNRRYTSE